MKGSEALVRMLEQLEVEYLFGLCGDTSLPFYDALCSSTEKVRHILTRDERSASYMAPGNSRISFFSSSMWFSRSLRRQNGS